MRLSVVPLLFFAVQIASADSGLLRVWNVESPVFNALGGAYNSYSSDGCTILLQRTPLVHRGPGGHSLKITYNNSNNRGCGVWIHLYKEESSIATAEFPDMTVYRYLSLWVKQNGKPQDIEIRMADPTWLARQDSKVAGLMSQYLKPASGDGWREVVVPFSDFHLPTAKAAVIVLQAAPRTAGVLYVDDINLKKGPDIEAGYSDALPSRDGAQRPRGMWLWESSELLKNPACEQAALTTLREARVTDLFLQIPYPKDVKDAVKPELETELRQFIKTAHSHSIRVHALDGSPDLSLRDQHPLVLSRIQSILAFNSSSRPEERFNGIHLDVEPYLLLGFDGPSRDEILQEYLELNEKVAGILHRDGGGLAFGVDIPFWWDTVRDQEHPCCTVRFNGVSTTAARHIINLADETWIMAYRNFATGLDGIVNHSQSEIDYSGSKGKHAFVAVETYRPAVENVVFVAAIKESQWQALPPNSPLLRMSRFQGYPLRSFTDGSYRFVGLAAQADSPGQAAFGNAVGALLRALPGRSTDWVFDLGRFRATAERYGRTAGEWQNAVICRLDRFNVPSGTGISVNQTMPAKTTLAGASRTFVNEILKEVSDAFDQNPGFGGDAIHSLESYQKLGN